MKAEPLTINQTAQVCEQIIQEVEKAVVGKRTVLLHMMAAFLSSGGHILLEDYPGLAKTLIANSFATALGMDFKRIQLKGISQLQVQVIDWQVSQPLFPLVRAAFGHLRGQRER